MKACGVEGTNQGRVTIYKTFFPIYTLYNRFMFKEQDEFCHGTH